KGLGMWHPIQHWGSASLAVVLSSIITSKGPLDEIPQNYQINSREQASVARRKSIQVDSIFRIVSGQTEISPCGFNQWSENYDSAWYGRLWSCPGMPFRRVRDGDTSCLPP